jgi:4-amino-4-deoxy-L-arabinose transferase-like glycosyltransferase
MLRSPMAIALLVQMAIWTLGPSLLVGNLHGDTLEAAYWGRDWALGYSKHPPLVTTLLDLALRSGAPAIFALMALSQLTVAVATIYIWRAVRLFASQETASLAALMYLASPAATFYAVQINHNSMLSPFLAAGAFYGLRYLDEWRWRDAIGLGVVAGLGMWTKYEILSLLVSLIALAGIVPRFRPVFARSSSYASVGVFFLVIAPHIWWSQRNGWPSLMHAVDYYKMTDIASVETSGQNLMTGVFAMCVAPALMLLATNAYRGPDEQSRVRERPVVALTLAFGPPLVLVLGAIASYEIIKPLWLQPFCVTTAGGLALLFPAGGQGVGLSERVSARISMIMSALIFLGFAIYLVIAGAIGKPLWAFSANTRALAAATQDMWDANASGPLRCVVIVDRKIGPSGVLWLKSRPDYVDFSAVDWSRPSQIANCRKTGGIAVLAESSQALNNFPRACLGARKRFDVPMMPLQGSATVPVDLVFIAPEGAAAGCGAGR